MDPLTHTLTGLALSRAGLNRRTAHATPLLLLAANAPDIDILAYAAGQASYLHYHRHLTHALVAIPFLALLPVLVVRLASRKPLDWKWAYLVSLLGVATHPLLDWTNVYGVRWFLPFSSEWVRADIFSLVDIWIWVVLLLAALAPALARLVSSEIGARPGSGRGWAIFALSFMALYGGGRYLLHERALAVLDARMYDGLTPLRVAAMPDMVNPFRWRGLVETEPFYSIYDLNLLREFDPAEGRILYKTEPGPAETAAANTARRTQAFEVFLDFSKYPLWRFSEASGTEPAMRVEVMDLRFGAPPRPRFVAEAVVRPNGQVERSGFAYEPKPD
jgi:inner membrane protein